MKAGPKETENTSTLLPCNPLRLMRNMWFRLSLYCAGEVKKVNEVSRKPVLLLKLMQVIASIYDSRRVHQESPGRHWRRTCFVIGSKSVKHTPRIIHEKPLFNAGFIQVSKARLLELLQDVRNRFGQKRLFITPEVSKRAQA